MHLVFWQSFYVKEWSASSLALVLEKSAQTELRRVKSEE